MRGIIICDNNYTLCGENDKEFLESRIIKEFLYKLVSTRMLITNNKMYKLCKNVIPESFEIWIQYNKEEEKIYTDDSRVKYMSNEFINNAYDGKYGSFMLMDSDLLSQYIYGMIYMYLIFIYNTPFNNNEILPSKYMNRFMISICNVRRYKQYKYSLIMQIDKDYRENFYTESDWCHIEYFRSLIKLLKGDDPNGN